MLFCLILLWKLLFLYDSLKVQNVMFKTKAFVWNIIFYYIIYIINVFTVTFDQFSASLLNKSINFLKRKKENFYWAQTYKNVV